MEATAALLQQQLDRLAQEGPTPKEMSRVKKSARATLLSGLQSNSSMAGILAAYHATTGSWRGVLDELAVVDDMQQQQVQDVVQRVFAKDNCFTGYVLPLKA